ncbi:MAG: MATE family efflux transporter [bacterium]
MSERELEKGNITGHIIYLALPMLIINLMQNGVSVYDMFLLGKIGVKAQAAVTIALFIVNIFWAIEGGLVVGTTAIISRYAGMKDKEKLKTVLINLIITAYIIGIIYAIIIYFTMDNILVFFNARGETFELSRKYLRMMLFSIMNDSGLFVFFTALRAAGYIKKHFVILLITISANLILEPILVLGLFGFPSLGVEGAALSRVFAYLISLGIMIWVFLTDKGILGVDLLKVKTDFKVITNYLKIAFPAVGQGLVTAAGNMMLLKLYTSYGDAFIAGTAIGGRLDVLLMMFGWAIGSATAIMVGHNMGAGNVKRAEQSVMASLKFYTIFTLASTIIYFSFSNLIAGIFTSDPVVLKTASLYLKIVSPFYALMGVGIIAIYGLNGAGATKTPMLVNIIGFFVVQIPLAYGLTKFTPLAEKGIFVSIAVTMFFQGIVGWWLYSRGKWKTKKI